MLYFTKVLQLYKQQNWDEAIKLFNMVSALDKGLRVAGVYVERCLDLQFNPPPEDWDGCYTMKTK